MKKSYLMAISTAFSFLSANASALESKINRASFCGATAMALGSAIKTAGGQDATYQTMMMQGLAWGKTAKDLGEKAGYQESKIKKLNQNSSKKAAEIIRQSGNFEESITMLNREYRNCINFAREDKRVLNIFQKYYN